jgi:hypothetical protein
MTVAPIGSVTSTPIAPPPRLDPPSHLPAVAPPAPQAALGATAAQAAEGADDVLYGASGLIIQSYGAIALISPAALLYANAALPPEPPRPLVAPVAAIAPVARVSNERRVDTAA